MEMDVENSGLVSVRLSGPHRLARLVEMLALFLGVPTLMAMRVVEVGLWPALLVGGSACLGALLLDGSFDRTRLWNFQGARAIFRGLLPMFGLSVVVLGFGVLVALPERFLQFPLQRPAFWLLVMVAYPVLSVYPQEIIFRAFFFHRYGPVFVRPGVTIGASAIAFGYAHIILHNWVAVTLSVIGGALFAWTYERSRSLLAASIEHALYGCAIFTLGLGWYFYAGAVR